MHYTQLADLILKIASSKGKSPAINILNVGGDEEITFEDILERIKINLPLEDSGRNCFCLKYQIDYFLFYAFLS